MERDSGYGHWTEHSASPTLELSQQRKWGQDPCARQVGYSGGMGAQCSSNTASLVQKLVPSVALPLYAGAWFPYLWL